MARETLADDEFAEPSCVTFDIPFASRTTTGRGCAAGAGEALRRAGATRIGVVANRSLRETDGFDRWLATIGGDVAVFSAVRAHTPRTTVLEAIGFFREHGCGGIVSIGSGSAIDTAKAAALGIAAHVSDLEGWDQCVRRVVEGTPGAMRAVPHFAIPTTLSGAAHSHSVGITDERRGEKVILIDPVLGPTWVFLDELVTRDTPPALWAGTGMKALEHAVEGLYARSLPPYAKPMRLHAFETVMRHLMASVEVTSDDVLDMRRHLLVAGGLAVLGWPSVGVGLSHALGHQAGAAWGIDHGASATIFLPRALAFNGAVATAAVDCMANALGDAPGDSVERILERLGEMTNALGLPSCLREAGVTAVDRLEHVARAAFRDPIMAGNPRAVTIGDLERILRSAY